MLSISWVDSVVGVPCLVENDGACQSSSNLNGSRVDCTGHARLTT